MAKVLILLLCLVFLVGCYPYSVFLTGNPFYIRRDPITTTPEDVIGIISATPEMNQAPLQSIEKMMGVVVMRFGHTCTTVTDIYLADPKNPKGTDLIVTCFDGQTGKNYRLTQSGDGQWSSVIPIDSYFGESVEYYFHLILFGQGFKCSKVSELFIIKVDKTYQAVCIEGQYKMAREKDEGFFTVTPW